MKKLTLIVFTFLLFASCSQDSRYLREALKAAGDNRTELEAVLEHYKIVDNDPEKLAAAKYLISNMPAHYSYRDTAAINSYYNTALSILGTGPNPDWQRDTLRQISNRDYPGLTRSIVSDIQIMTADYLIHNIDHAFTQWKTRPWARHLTYEEFRYWLLPYKVTELQSFDNWRDVLSSYYSDSISMVPETDVNRNSIYGAIEIVRNEIHSKQSDIGLRVIWEGEAGISLRSAQTWTHMTYGSCMDYVTMGTAVFRSLGLPATIDMVPLWGRNSAGHCWYVFPSDRGKEETTINALIMPAGQQFYAYERIPKVWRNTYTINRDVEKYLKASRFKHSFNPCMEDVTDHYNLTSDIEIQTIASQVSMLKDRRYAYIATAVNNNGPQWKILDYGTLKRGKANFKKMGRNILYVVLGYDGYETIPISQPFILHKNGKIEYVNTNINDRSSVTKTTSVDLRRKYFESYNVADMRRRILGGKLQCSDNLEFRNAKTLYTIETTYIPARIELPKATGAHRYWRYLSPDGSWGSISELSFYDENGKKLEGRGIANPEAGQDAIDRAYDGNLLSNFEINQPDGNWVGLDMSRPTEVRYFSVSPRSDDNDVCPENEYELLYFDGDDWCSLGYQIATGNTLHYDDVPLNTLLWLCNYTRGNNERPFIIRDNGEIDWW